MKNGKRSAAAAQTLQVGQEQQAQQPQAAATRTQWALG
jgi:hypothetical protein